MNLEEVMRELAALGTERTKKAYMNNGAREPLFGVATGAMKPLFKKIKINQPLAELLYDTGNYDAMYFAGMIADPKAMTKAHFDRWIEAAYFYMLSDYVVAVTLAEADCAQEVADCWIEDGRELVMSAGWACYEWLLGWRPDEVFSRDKLDAMLKKVVKTIASQPHRTRYAMNNFVAAVGVSFIPLHEEAIKAAQAIGGLTAVATAAAPKEASSLPSALEAIQRAKAKGKVGFKRRAVRC